MAIETEPTPEIVYHQSNHWDVYPTRSDVELASILPLPEGIGVELQLRSNIENFDHFLYATNDKPPRKSSGQEIVIRFAENHPPEIQRTTTVIQAVAENDKKSSEYKIDINFFSREYYATSGRTSTGYLMVQGSDLPISATTVEDFIIERPTPEEVTFAQQQWGNLIDPGRSDHENACAIARSILTDLNDHRGVPSDIMEQSSPLIQYQRAMAGQDGVWCGNIASIFSYACNALGIPTRYIRMSRDSETQAPESSDYTLRLATGHRTTEIFDRETNQWVWMDLAFSILGAYLGNVGPLNMMELHHAINNPARVRDLSIASYIPAEKTDRTDPLLECERSYSCFNSLKRTQKFFYMKVC